MLRIVSYNPRDHGTSLLLDTSPAITEEDAKEGTMATMVPFSVCFGVGLKKLIRMEKRLLAVYAVTKMRVCMFYQET